MVVKRKNGYYVLSEKTRRNLGGSYTTRAAAVKRLRQVEFLNIAASRFYELLL